MHIVQVLGLAAVGGRLGILLAVPLLAPLPGLWRGRLYPYAVASLLLVFYAGGFLMEAFTHPARRALALALATVAVLEFCAVVVFVRVRAAELRRASGTPASPGRSR